AILRNRKAACFLWRFARLGISSGRRAKFRRSSRLQRNGSNGTRTGSGELRSRCAAVHGKGRVESPARSVLRIAGILLPHFVSTARKVLGNSFGCHPSQAGGIEAMKILVRAPNWVGDAVMCIPALEAMRRSRAGDEISILARPA